jgi:predicted porin
MKKSLFALAAVTAFAGAAQAQSSVTVYGILDVGYVGGNERVAGLAANNGASAGNQVVKQNANTFGASAQSTSRLGFRGREDMGGGMAAFFTLETAITPNSSTDGATNSIFSTARAAFVGLSQKGVGQASIGLQNTVITDAISPTLTGQFNNIVGSMLFPGNTNPPTNAGTSGGAGLLSQNSANGNTDAFTFRTSNTLKLQTERMAGLQGSLMVVMNDSTRTQGIVSPATSQGYTGGKNNANGWGIGLNYNFKKFTGTAAYQSLKAVDAYNVTAAQAAVGGFGTPSPTGAPVPFNAGSGAAGVNVTDNQAYVGATYDFGILKAYAGWIDRKVTSQINGNAYAKRTAQEIGVRGNWTPKIESWASIGNGRITTFGANEPTANIGGWQVGSNYILSKRTNLYAIYGQNGTSNVSNSATGVNRSFNSNQYALGVRHTF